MARKLTCSNCSAELERASIGGGEQRFYCPECGWGKDRIPGKPIGPEVHKTDNKWSSVEPLTVGGTAILWLVILFIVLVPYLGVSLYLEDAYPYVDYSLFKKFYFPALCLYVLVCWFFHPEFWGNHDGPTLSGSIAMGAIPGMGFLPIAVTPREHVNQFIEAIILVMIPGKLACFAIYSTWKLFFP